MRERLRRVSEPLQFTLENMAFTRKLVDGTLKPQEYVNYLYDMKLLYEVMEKHRYFKELHWGIDMAKRCEDDLQRMEYLYGVKRAYPRPVIKGLVNYIKDLGFTQYSAHCFVRYTADLNGGPVIKRALNKHHPKWPTTLYDIKDGRQDIMDDFINLRVQHHELFLTEIAISYKWYQPLLRMEEDDDSDDDDYFYR